MTAGHFPVVVDLKSAGPDFWRRYHELRRVRQKESRPDDPVRPDELEEAGVKRGSPFYIPYRYEIARDGRLLGWLSGSTSKPGKTGHEFNKHPFLSDLCV